MAPGLWQFIVTAPTIDELQNQVDKLHAFTKTSPLLHDFFDDEEKKDTSDGNPKPFHNQLELQDLEFFGKFAEY